MTRLLLWVRIYWRRWRGYPKPITRLDVLRRMGVR